MNNKDIPIINQKVQYPELCDPDWLYNKRFVESISDREIANSLGASLATIKKKISEYKKTVWKDLL